MYSKMKHSFGVIKVREYLDGFRTSRFFVGALCVYEGIVDSLWNGTSDLSLLKKVAEIEGLI